MAIRITESGASKARPDGLLWDEWAGPREEIRVLRSALHRMAKWVVSKEPLPSHVYEREEQEIVDHFVAGARMAGDGDIPLPGEIVV